jgi:macrolide transport system ATP-binding/permease protein
MAVLSLALGIGANTAIYSFMDAIMVRALPVKHPEELVILNWRAKKDAPVVHNHWVSSYTDPGGETSPNFPYHAYELFRNHNDVLTSLFGHA